MVKIASAVKGKGRKAAGVSQALEAERNSVEKDLHAHFQGKFILLSDAVSKDSSLKKQVADGVARLKEEHGITVKGIVPASMCTAKGEYGVLIIHPSNTRVNNIEEVLAQKLGMFVESTEWFDSIFGMYDEIEEASKSATTAALPKSLWSNAYLELAP